MMNVTHGTITLDKPRIIRDISIENYLGEEVSIRVEGSEVSDKLFIILKKEKKENKNEN